MRRPFPCPSCASGNQCAPSRGGPHAARQTHKPARFPARQPVRGRVRFPAETGMTDRPVKPQAVAELNIPVDSKTDTAPKAVKTIWSAGPGNNNMPSIVVINLSCSLPVYVSKGPLARPPPPRGEAGRGRPRRGRARLIRANVGRARLPGGARLASEKARRRGTPDGNRIDADCACGLPFERTTGPRRPRGINGPFTGFTFEFPPQKKGGNSANSSRKMVDMGGKPR